MAKIAWEALGEPLGAQPPHNYLLDLRLEELRQGLHVQLSVAPDETVVADRDLVPQDLLPI